LNERIRHNSTKARERIQNLRIICRSGLSLNVCSRSIEICLSRNMIFHRFDHAAQGLDATLLFSPSKQSLCRVSIFRCFNRCALCLNASPLKRAPRPALNILHAVKYRQFCAKNRQSTDVSRSSFKFLRQL